MLSKEVLSLPVVTDSFDKILESSDALYIISEPENHYEQIKKALLKGKHVLCESPVALKISEWDELVKLAEEKKCILMDGIKTAYSDAYNHLLLLLKSGIIGKIVSIDCTCTSLKNFENLESSDSWNSICSWGPTVLLPVFQLLGTSYKSKTIVTHFLNEQKKIDSFTKIDFIYSDAVASIKVGQGVKSEGELVISSSKGYVYVPAPWWKTDYFEIRYENPQDNKRYFYQLDGEGIRYEIVSFIKAIQSCKNYSYIDKNVSEGIIKIMQDFNSGTDVVKI